MWWSRDELSNRLFEGSPYKVSLDDFLLEVVVDPVVSGDNRSGQAACYVVKNVWHCLLNGIASSGQRYGFGWARTDTKAAAEALG